MYQQRCVGLSTGAAPPQQGVGPLTDALPAAHVVRARACSCVLTPLQIMQVREIPYTLNGKKVEVPVRKVCTPDLSFGTCSSLAAGRCSLRCEGFGRSFGD